MSFTPGDVPCDGCTLCCHNDAVRVELDEERAAGRRFNYRLVPHTEIPGKVMLDHKPNGDCIYLETTGCRIWKQRPTLCRTMDCRVLALRIPPLKAADFEARGLLPKGVIGRGRDLLEDLTIARRVKTG